MLRIDSQADRPTGRSVEPDDSSSPIRPGSGIEPIRRSSPTEEHRSPPGEAIRDALDLSPQGLAASEAERKDSAADRSSDESEASARSDDAREASRIPNSDEAESAKDKEEEGEDSKELSLEEQEAVRQFKQRDREVRSHEQAHLSAAGSLAHGGMRLEFERGPDGKRYATSGNVNISLRRGKNPEETMRLARQAQRAALAPADPSPQDRRVAAKAADMQQDARREIQEEEFQESRGRMDEVRKESVPTRPTDLAEVSESAPSDARPDPVYIQTAEAQAQHGPKRHAQSFESAQLDASRDPLAIGLSRRAVQAYSSQADVGEERHSSPHHA